MSLDARGVLSIDLVTIAGPPAGDAVVKAANPLSPAPAVKGAQMLAEAVVRAEREAGTVAARLTPPERWERLQWLISQTVSDAHDALEVTIVERCGEIEVRVGGPSGGLRLSFDRAADPGFVRSSVRRTVDRYGLGGPNARKARSRREEE
jgi:hypothetical protein